MNTSAFSRKESIRYGWNTMKQNFGFLFVVQLIVLAATIIENAVSKAEESKESLTFVFLGIALTIISIILSIGLMRIVLAITKEETPRFADLVEGYPLFFKFIASEILMGLITIGGLLLLVVPGIIWGTRFRFASYIVVDEGMGPIKALKASWAMTKGSVWNLLILEFYLSLITLAGVAALAVGLFAAAPTVLLTRAKVYRTLKQQGNR